MGVELSMKRAIGIETTTLTSRSNFIGDPFSGLLVDDGHVAGCQFHLLFRIAFTLVCRGKPSIAARPTRPSQVSAKARAVYNVWWPGWICEEFIDLGPTSEMLCRGPVSIIVCWRDCSMRWDCLANASDVEHRMSTVFFGNYDDRRKWPYRVWESRWCSRGAQLLCLYWSSRNYRYLTVDK